MHVLRVIRTTAIGLLHLRVDDQPRAPPQSPASGPTVIDPEPTFTVLRSGH
jgi:hypothetical protein